ncbi:TonB-dependent receptor [Hirschia litorea]|uniref:TonB-dependent receptor n=1 Tax=Hirschia litorea TaxID=1199156 RepID=A0ABW2IPI4_9PROT
MRSGLRNSSAVVALLSAIAISPAIAQEAAVETTAQQAADEDRAVLDTIVVTGIRSSLKDAMDIKRSGQGVVDAISAEDIGKFPDTNLAESLQRITGVSIDRSNNEGNQVTVRGFGPSFNMVTLNGRQMPRSSSLLTDGIPRSFNFRELSSELVSGIEVYKTGRSDVDSGGIGSTINVKTARPFDNKGFQAFGSLKGIADLSVENGDSVTPEISGLISHTFMDDKFGVLLALSQSERDSHRDRAGTQGWVRNRGQNIDTSAVDNGTGSWWAPWTVDLDSWDTERTRQNGQLVLQFAPTNDITATVDYTATRFEQSTSMNRQSLWFDNPTGAADVNGTLVNPIQTNDELNFWAWQFEEKTESDSIGLNLEWQATDTLSFELDVHDSTSKSNPNGVNSEQLANLANPGKLVNYSADFSGDIPTVDVDDSALTGGAYNADNIIADLFQTRGYQIDNNVQQIKLGGTWENAGDGALTQVKFGVQKTKYAVDTKTFGTFAFVTSLDLTGLGLTFDNAGDALDEFGDASQTFPFIPNYSALGFIELTKGQDLFFQSAPSLNGVEEQTLAMYVNADFETEFNGMPIYANAGVRFEDTDVEAYSVQPAITNLQYWHEEEIQLVTGDDVPAGLSGGYKRMLPNFDMKVDITDALVGRFSYGKTMTRSGLGNMFPSTTITQRRPGDIFKASQGNPGLLPYESDNFDFSLEYYYNDASYVSVGYFQKYVDNFIGQSTELRTINDAAGNPLTDPSVDPGAGCPSSVIPTEACLNRPDQPVIMFETTTTTNQGSAEVDGWELNVQHMFGETGFGAIANYTIVNADVAYDIRQIDGNRALTGLSDSANLVAFYEKNGIQARIAYNWRDEFLLAGGNEPTFTEAYGQIDANASYEINPHFTVFVEGLNLTNETTRTHGRYKEQLLSAEQYGPRINFGVRAKF